MTILPAGGVRRDGVYHVRFGSTFSLDTPQDLAPDARDKRASRRVMSRLPSCCLSDCAAPLFRDKIPVFVTAHPLRRLELRSLRISLKPSQGCLSSSSAMERFSGGRTQCSIMPACAERRQLAVLRPAKGALMAPKRQVDHTGRPVSVGLGGRPQISPDGTWVAFVNSPWIKSTTIITARCGSFPPPAARRAQVTSGNSQDHSPRWSPMGGRSRSFPRDADNNKPQIYLIEAKITRARSEMLAQTLETLQV